MIVCLLPIFAVVDVERGVTNEKEILGDATNVVRHRLRDNSNSNPTSLTNMSNSNLLRAAILVVSTTASKDPSTDSSSGILSEVFEKEGAGKWAVDEVKIVGDDVLDIQRNITAWADREDAVNLIVSTGGTGFAVHDSTPEV